MRGFMQQLWQNLFNNFVKAAYSSREAISITLSPYNKNGLFLRRVDNKKGHLLINIEDGLYPLDEQAAQNFYGFLGKVHYAWQVDFI